MDEDRFLQIPGEALNISSRLQLSSSLDPDNPLLSENGLPIDYRGLACLMNFENIDVKNFERTGSPTMKILEEWEKRTDATIGQLLDFLKKMGRYGLIEDILPFIEKDADAFLKKMAKSQEIPLPVPKVASCQKNDLQLRGNADASTCDDVRIGGASSLKTDIQIRNDANALTCDDVKTGECTLYDAYLCYAEDNEDAALAVARVLEAQLGFKLFIHHRDSLSGQNELISNIQLIKERCRRMLILLSPEFLKSTACEFQISFASSLAIEQRERILIPIVVAPVNSSEIPLIIRYISKIDFTRQGIQDWNWRRLISSLGKFQQHNINAVPTSMLESIPIGRSTDTCLENSSPATTNPSIEFPPSQNDIAISKSLPAEYLPSHSNISILNNTVSNHVATSHSDPSTAAPTISNVGILHESKSNVGPTGAEKTMEFSTASHSANKMSKPSSFDNILRFFKGKKSLKPSSPIKRQLSPSSASSTSDATSGFYSHNYLDTESIEGLAKDCSLNTHA